MNLVFCINGVISSSLIWKRVLITSPQNKIQGPYFIGRKYFIIHHRDMSRMNIFFPNCSLLQKSPSYKGTDCIGSYKSNYHTIMTTMVPFPIMNLGCGSHILIFDTRTVLDLQKFESSNHNDALCNILYQFLY